MFYFPGLALGLCSGLHSVCIQGVIHLPLSLADRLDSVRQRREEGENVDYCWYGIWEVELTTGVW